MDNVSEVPNPTSEAISTRLNEALDNPEDIAKTKELYEGLLDSIYCTTNGKIWDTKAATSVAMEFPQTAAFKNGLYSEIAFFPGKDLNDEQTAVVIINDRTIKDTPASIINIRAILGEKGHDATFIRHLNQPHFSYEQTMVAFTALTLGIKPQEVK